MSTLISGLNEAECRDFVGVECWNKQAFRWCAPENLAAEADGQSSIWLYRAPWSALDQAAGEGEVGIPGNLAHWLEHNRAILNARKQFNDNLLLVNADRVQSADLRARLDGAAAGHRATGEQPASPGSPYGSLLGQLFVWSAPQYWDVLEALEAASWLPSGEPLFRNDCAANEDQLNSLLSVLHTHPQTNRELLQLRQASDGMVASGHQLKQENDGLRQESELLLLQLHQVQEELEQYYLKNLELDKAAAASMKSAKDAQSKLAQNQQALADTKKAVGDSQHKTKALQLQLQQMQDELRHQQSLLAASVVKPQVAQVTPLGRLVPSPARKILHRVRDKKRRLAQLDAIRKSSWFDGQWYLDIYPDIRTAKIDPAEHYLTTGWKESRNPSDKFDTAYYLRSNPDITQSGLNPLWHFIAFGSKEGRLPRKP